MKGFGTLGGSTLKLDSTQFHGPFSKPRLRLWIRLGLAWARGYCFAYAHRATDERMELDAESEAVVSKRAIELRKHNEQFSTKKIGLPE